MNMKIDRIYIIHFPCLTERKEYMDKKIKDFNVPYEYVCKYVKTSVEIFDKKFIDVSETNKNRKNSMLVGDKAHAGHNSEIIHYEWYQKVLTALSGSKDFSITSNKINESSCTSKERQEEYIKHIITTEDRILTADQDILKEFLEVMTYNTIICSNSTWGWWACFLSNAENIYTFDKFGMFGVPLLRTHGIHVNALSNIRNISRVVEGSLIDISSL